MRRLGAFLAAGGLLAGCAHLECLSHGGDSWRAVRTPHFTLQTDLDSETARAQALKLEATRAALRWFFELGDAGDGIRVVMVKDSDALGEFTWAEGFVGSSIHPDELLVVTSFSPGNRRGSAEVAAHELAHRYAAEAFPVALPSWLNEGLAGYLESVLILDDRRATLGLTGRLFGYFTLGTYANPLKLHELWDFTPDGAREGNERDKGYASAALYVHYLANHEPARWAAFLKSLREGRPPRTSFEAIFPPAEQARLDEQVGDYADSRRYNTTDLLLSYDGRVLSEAELPDWWVHLLRAELWRHADDGRDRARDRDEVLVARGMLGAQTPWELAWWLGSYDGNLLTLARGFPDEFEAQLGLGRAGGAGAAEHLEKALRLRPSSPSANEALAELELASGDIAGADEHLETARRAAPWDEWVMELSAVVASKRGRCGDVERWLDRARSLTGETPTSADVSKFESMRADLLARCDAARSAPAASPSP